MRYFGTGDFSGRVNFVDAFNVFVGYDMHGMCCEKFEWFVTDVAHFNDGHEYWEARTRAEVGEFGEPKSNVNEIEGWDEYRFDVNWCNVIENMDMRPYYPAECSDIYSPADWIHAADSRMLDGKRIQKGQIYSGP